MPTPEKIQCAHCGEVRNFRNPCCPNERMRRHRIKQGRSKVEKELDMLIVLKRKSTVETCAFCDKVRNKRAICCKKEAFRRRRLKEKTDLDYQPHRCVDCGKVSENYRCKACTIRHRKKHGMPVRGGLDWLE